MLYLPALPYLWILVAAAATTAGLGVYAWRRRDVPGALPFAILLASITTRTLANALELAGADLLTKAFWANVQYLSCIPVALSWLALALQYTGQQAWLTRRRIAVLLIVPLGVAALAWTNDFHKLVQDNICLVTAGPFPVIDKTYGPVFWMHLVYHYTLFGVTAFLLIRALRYAPALYRGQIAILLICLFLPATMYMLYSLGLGPIPGYDTSSAVLSVCGPVMAWGLFRYRLFNVMPIARATVVDQLDMGVIVLDAHRRIVNVNPTAQRMLGLSATQVVGRPATTGLSAWQELLTLSQDLRQTHIESTNESRQYELRTLPLTDQAAHRLGQLLILLDITERKQMEALLLYQQESMAVMQDRERLARELHDGLAQDLAGLRLRISVWHKLAQVDPARLHTEIDAVGEILGGNIREVRRTIYALRPLNWDELGFFPALRQFVSDFGKQTVLAIDLRVTGSESSLPAPFELVLFRIIQESLYNVSKHAQASQVWIAVALLPDGMTLTLRDNGRGFDLAGLAEAIANGHLGLAQMRQRVQDLHGTFSVTSQPGQGTEIRVVLPH